jgi:hypothetical protein
VTQRSVHSAHPRGCAWTAGEFGGAGDFAGASGTMSADGNVCSAGQLAHGGAATARAISIAITAATSTNMPPQVRARRTGNGSGIIDRFISSQTSNAFFDQARNLRIQGRSATI